MLFKILEKNYQNKISDVDMSLKRDIFNKLSAEFKIHNLILVGLRQIGKTTLAEQIINSFIEKEDKYYYMNLLSLGNFSPQSLTKFLIEGEYKYILLDEIQHIPNWTSYVQQLVDLMPKSKFIFTGSNAKALLDETMVNRTKVYYINPLSLSEFRMFWGNNASLDDYLKYGSYPKFEKYNDYKIQYSEIVEEQIIDKIIYKDSPTTISASKFKSLMAKMSNFIGNDLKVKRLEDSTISRPTAKNYLKLMVQSRLISMVYKYNDKSDKVVGKAYFVDKSMIYKFNNDSLNTNLTGSLIENIVFNHLENKYNCKFGFDNIFVYKSPSGKEIDFIVPHEKILLEVKYIQYSTEDNAMALAKEYSSRVKVAEKDYRKIIVTDNINGSYGEWEFISLGKFLML
ncbi:MAG: ATP-binding protein [Mycoplasmataceae bacterium]|nr:ATP-binding protein [Mycoplasmataceae bacterium]